MLLEEAEKVAAIIATADNGCYGCVTDLVEMMNENFPEFVWALTDDYPTKVVVAVVGK